MDWQSRLEHQMDNPITHEITVLVKDLLMPLAEKTRVNASEFERMLKEEISMADIDEYSQMACRYLDKIKKCECLENELSKQKENVQRIENKAKTVYEVVSMRNDPEAHVARTDWWL
ncbi:hypothetical protein Tco_1188942 [Tanacetum coccineum]